MSLTESTRRTIRRHGLLPRDTPCRCCLVGRCRFSGVALCAERDRGDRRFSCRRCRPSQPSAAWIRMRMPTKSSAADWPTDLGIPSTSGAYRHRRACAGGGRFHRTRGPRRSARVLLARCGPRNRLRQSRWRTPRDDQAETFLLRLLRGAGPRGLGGMHPRSGSSCGRSSRPIVPIVRAFLEAREYCFPRRPTNSDTTIPRNRIRHELVPFLETHFSPGVVDVLDREAAIAREDADYLDAAAAARWPID